MVELLNTLITLHSNNSLKATLQFDLAKILEGDVKAQIKEKIVNGVKNVLKTVVLVYACFVGELYYLSPIDYCTSVNKCVVCIVDMF